MGSIPRFWLIGVCPILGLNALCHNAPLGFKQYGSLILQNSNTIMVCCTIYPILTKTFYNARAGGLFFLFIYFWVGIGVYTATQHSSQHHSLEYSGSQHIAPTSKHKAHGLDFITVQGITVWSTQLHSSRHNRVLGLDFTTTHHSTRHHSLG